jgi:hypothetical protein
VRTPGMAEASEAGGSRPMGTGRRRYGPATSSLTSSLLMVCKHHAGVRSGAHGRNPNPNLQPGRPFVSLRSSAAGPTSMPHRAQRATPQGHALKTRPRTQHRWLNGKLSVGRHGSDGAVRLWPWLDGDLRAAVPGGVRGVAADLGGREDGSPRRVTHGSASRISSRRWAASGSVPTQRGHRCRSVLPKATPRNGHLRGSFMSCFTGGMERPSMVRSAGHDSTTSSSRW